MEITEQDAKRIFTVDKSFQAAGMKPLSSDELRALAEKVAGGGSFQTLDFWRGGEKPGDAGVLPSAGIPGGIGQPAAPGAMPSAQEGSPLGGLEGGLTPKPPETTGGLSRLPTGKGRVMVDTDEQGRVTKITQTLTPG